MHIKTLSAYVFLVQLSQPPHHNGNLLPGGHYGGTGEELRGPSLLDDNVINVSYDYCRIMTTLDRRGKLD